MCELYFLIVAKFPAIKSILSHKCSSQSNELIASTDTMFYVDYIHLYLTQVFCVFTW